MFNEKPSTDDALAEAGGEGEERAVLPRGAVLHTSRGDITLRLFPDEARAHPLALATLQGSSVRLRFILQVHTLQDGMQVASGAWEGAGLTAHRRPEHQQSPVEAFLAHVGYGDSAMPPSPVSTAAHTSKGRQHCSGLACIMTQGADEVLLGQKPI